MTAAGITADITPEEACEIMIAEMQKLTVDGLMKLCSENRKEALDNDRMLLS